MNTKNMQDKLARIKNMLAAAEDTKRRLTTIERTSIHPIYLETPENEQDCPGVAIQLRDAYEPDEVANATINLNGLELEDIPSGETFRIHPNTLHDLAAMATMFKLGHLTCLREVAGVLGLNDSDNDSEKGGKE